MRAKLKVTQVVEYPAQGPVESEVIHFQAVSKSEPYSEDGQDEDNTYAKFTPTASLEIHIANPALLGKHKVGDTFYVDFTPTK